eukprot:1878140-Pleurochrysis_carterae.AAC.2
MYIAVVEVSRTAARSCEVQTSPLHCPSSPRLPSSVESPVSARWCSCRIRDGPSWFQGVERAACTPLRSLRLMHAGFACVYKTECATRHVVGMSRF